MYIWITNKTLDYGEVHDMVRISVKEGQSMHSIGEML